MRVQVPMDVSVAEAVALVRTKCPASTPRDLMSLCVNPTRDYPEEFRSSPGFPFLDDAATIESCMELIRTSAVLYASCLRVKCVL